MKWFTFIQVVAYAVHGKPDEFHNVRVIIPANAIVKVGEILEIDGDDQLFYNAGARTEIKLADNDEICVIETVETIYDMIKELGD